MEETAIIEVLAALLFILTILLIAYVLYLKRERTVLLREIEVRAAKRFDEMKDAFRRDILAASRASLKGRIAEQIVPFLEQFRYNPSDARFIGSPIDYVIFDGYTKVKDDKEDQPITVVLAEVKSGWSASLTPEQEQIKKAVEERRVKWDTIRLTESLARDEKEDEVKKAYDLDQIRKRHPRAYEKWTSDEDVLLKAKYGEGLNISELATLLQRQPGAIRSRLRRLGLIES